MKEKGLPVSLTKIVRLKTTYPSIVGRILPSSALIENSIETSQKIKN